MSSLFKLKYMFYSGDAANLIGVHRSTINRALNSGKMEGRQMPNGHWLISLDGINQQRGTRGLPPISKEDADRYWETGVVPL